MAGEENEIEELIDVAAISTEILQNTFKRTSDFSLQINTPYEVSTLTSLAVKAITPKFDITKQSQAKTMLDHILS